MTLRRAALPLFTASNSPLVAGCDEVSVLLGRLAVDPTCSETCLLLTTININYFRSDLSFLSYFLRSSSYRHSSSK